MVTWTRDRETQEDKTRQGKMAELTFAKSFLAMLDARPVKLSDDHVEDPQSYPARSAVCS